MKQRKIQPGADVETFLADLPARKAPKLAPWTDHIRQLLECGASYQDIVDFLNGNGVHAGVSELFKFAHAKKRAGVFQAVLEARRKPKATGDQPASGLPAPVPPVAQATDQSPAAQQQAVSSPQPVTEKKPGELPKFTWDVTKKREVDW